MKAGGHRRGGEEVTGRGGDGARGGFGDKGLGRLEKPVFWFGDHIYQAS